MQTNVVNQMRHLKLEFDAGRIDEMTYLARFREINASIGQACAWCDRATAVVWRGLDAICASCELGL